MEKPKTSKISKVIKQLKCFRVKYPNVVSRAEAIAKWAHKKQKRWSGEPYIQHPRRVVERVGSLLFIPMEETKAAAWLHDVLEDVPEITAHLLEVYAGFPIKIIKPISLLTRLNTDNYFQFIIRIRESSNTVAMAVKMADLDDNMSDLKECSLKDKYRLAHFILRQKFNTER